MRRIADPARLRAAGSESVCMSEEFVTEARRRLKDLAAKAVAAARTAAAAAPAAGAKTPASAEAADDPAADAPAPDERDEIIARLERDIEAERARSAELEGAVKALEFKLDVLERSYGKQLADARAASEDAKKELATVMTQLAETARELSDAAAHRDRLRDMLAFDGRRVPPEMREHRPGNDDTIARLMSTPGPDARSDGASPSRRAASNDTDAVELLSPDLVFDPSRDGDDG